MDDKVSKLKSIADLRDSGILSEREFKAEKAKIMAEPSVGQQPYGAPQQPYGGPPPMGQDPPVDEGFKMLMYVVSFLFPIAGVVVGIIFVKFCETGNNIVPPTSKKIATIKIRYVLITT